MNELNDDPGLAVIGTYEPYATPKGLGVIGTYEPYATSKGLAVIGTVLTEDLNAPFYYMAGGDY